MPLLPEVYARVFEVNPEGAAVLAELEQKFVRGAVTEGGVDGVLKTYQRDGERRVIEWILKRINQANGALPNDE